MAKTKTTAKYLTVNFLELKAHPKNPKDHDVDAIKSLYRETDCLILLKSMKKTQF